MTKKLQDLHPESARKLAELLSYGIFLEEKDKSQIKRSPGKWIDGRLNAPQPEVFSSLLLFNPYQCHDKESHFLRESLSGDACVFRMDVGFPDLKYGRPANGQFYVVCDLGNDDLIRIRASVYGEPEVIIIRKVEFFSAQDRHRVLHETNKERLMYRLDRAIRNTDQHDAPLNDDDIIDALNSVLAKHPSIESKLQAKIIGEVIEEADRPAVIRRGMV